MKAKDYAKEVKRMSEEDGLDMQASVKWAIEAMSLEFLYLLKKRRAKAQEAVLSMFVEQQDKWCAFLKHLFSYSDAESVRTLLTCTWLDAIHLYDSEPARKLRDLVPPGLLEVYMAARTKR